MHQVRLRVHQSSWAQLHGFRAEPNMCVVHDRLQRDWLTGRQLMASAHPRQLAQSAIAKIALRRGH